MFDLEVKMNTEMTKHMLRENASLSSTTDAFSKILESANKSFEMTKQLFKSYTNKNVSTRKEDAIFGKISFATFNKNSSKQVSALNENISKRKSIHPENKKDENSYIEEEQEKQKSDNDSTQANKIPINSESIFTAKVITNEANEATNNLSDNAKELRETGEKLLKIKEQSKEMCAYLQKEMSSSEKATTQNPIKPQNLVSEYIKKTSDVFVKPEILANLKTSIPQTQTRNTPSTLSEVMAELDIDIEVNSIKENNQMQNNNHQTSFNFNTTTFGDLNGHVTKLSLNKAADFNKIMNQKMTQDQQIVNQVKEAASGNLTKGTKSVNIILRPEHLGRVNVNLISNNGVLTAQFTAQNQQAADALNKNIETLKQNLIDQGIKVNDISVKIQETNHSENYTNNQTFQEDKSSDFREQTPHKNSSFTKKTVINNYEQNNSYEKEEYITNNNEQNAHTNSRKNNDLGIYNNMGRKV